MLGGGVDRQLVVAVVVADCGEHRAGVVQAGQAGALGMLLRPAARGAGQAGMDDTGGRVQPPLEVVQHLQRA